MDSFLLEIEDEDNMKKSIKSQQQQQYTHKQIISLLKIIMMEPKAQRFAPVEEEGIENAPSCRVPRATKEATKQWLSVFNSYLEANEIVRDLATASEEEIVVVLSKRYLGIRTQKSEYYQRVSHARFRAALNRHLLDRGINGISDPSFFRATEVFDGVLKKLEREGSLRPTEHKDEITKKDLDTVNKLFIRCKDAVTLSCHVWFIITYHLGLRGRELQCKLQKNQLEIFTHNGSEYCQLASEFGTKNQQGEVNRLHDLKQLHFQMHIYKLANPVYR